MPRRPSLTPPQLASAALDVVDRDGLAGLTMRAVATQLGVSTMGLYRYVKDRDELEALVVETVLGEIDTDPPAPAQGASWQDQLTVMARRLRDAVGTHPSTVPLALTRRYRSQAIMRWSETVLAILATAGIHGEQRVIALRALLAYAIGAIQLEHLGGPSGLDALAAAPGTPAAGDFPLLAESGPVANAITRDAEFHGGLAVLLRGLAR
ncbi:TetR/AcrR family transcriptional regulator C-terminal domain-containing protein [Frankia sp. CNm7]|uniref:TetR/AcrR family transcriptional regulator C-terminal domain-containing protein n=1 Tax=Frankia nepalensis TaxID=1836974 RepID=A0A937UMJ2_9ACTN|nr:TetR/AcrR family transcriptional regulator C-terminal domain-containing protein [Frankia nepalensis]MBL7496834.1 TetR/AcrR family transcriptional regulator C-terminal domain-containing protein [Frankia nepalensis]MBL7510955.1 TetR/AcrR family transcriptional regulator C-terminal domain-containing protein [Frankia nepalensis]MBL7523480.1 TetR/AcrR family transcriptional regulator C-terminal domain-containing protein [Frankia nepalensis]MBL7626912.1 TetR/AcrR family transcriptional regulator C